MPTLEQFKNAGSVLKGVIRETSLIDSPALSKGCGNRVYLKPENMQVTGAYKIRGAYYKISTLTQEQRERGLVTASAGNHAQGVAYAAQAAGVPATIVMPTTTPLVKVNNTKDYGAKVILHGEVFDESAELAAKLAEEEGLTYIHPFNDLEVATGQGTIGVQTFFRPAGLVTAQPFLQRQVDGIQVGAIQRRHLVEHLVGLGIGLRIHDWLSRIDRSAPRALRQKWLTLWLNSASWASARGCS